jgi:hypothetical protein
MKPDILHLEFEELNIEDLSKRKKNGTLVGDAQITLEAAS